MAVRNTPLHNAWCNMKARCQGRHSGSESYPGRGITYCLEWETFAGFYKDMAPSWKPGLTLDRTDNNLGYSKENCRWASRAEQQQNTRKTKLTMEQADALRNLAVSGYSVAEAADIVQVHYQNAYDVIKRGYWK